MVCEPSTDRGRRPWASRLCPISPAAQGEASSAIWPTLPSIHPYHWQNFQSAAGSPPVHTGRPLGELMGATPLEIKLLALVAP